MDFNKLIARVKGILMTPKTEWPVIAGEPTTVADLYKGYILWLAAIPPLFSFLMMARFAAGAALSQLVLAYVLTLGMLYVMALVTDALAPNFGGTRDRVQVFEQQAGVLERALLAGGLHVHQHVAGGQDGCETIHLLNTTTDRSDTAGRGAESHDSSVNYRNAMLHRTVDRAHACGVLLHCRNRVQPQWKRPRGAVCLLSAWRQAARRFGAG